MKVIFLITIILFSSCKNNNPCGKRSKQNKNTYTGKVIVIANSVAKEDYKEPPPYITTTQRLDSCFPLIDTYRSISGYKKK